METKEIQETISENNDLVFDLEIPVMEIPEMDFGDYDLTDLTDL